MTVELSAKFGGLGIEVTMEKGVVKVVSPIDGTPAAESGILANDLIVDIDGDEVDHMSLDQAVDRMRGAVNTPITLTIERQGIDKPFDVKLVRREIVVQSVSSRAEGEVGYIRIREFGEQTFGGLEAAIGKLSDAIGRDRIKGLVIDLRNDPGGLLDQAIAVSDAFLDRGEIVSIRGRDPSDRQRADAHRGDMVRGKPIIVLINGGSASASEIVAGALQDDQRATILGTRSFGKGSVQTIIRLGADGALRLTTARYYTPSGRSIQAKGIDPDIVVQQDIPPDIGQADIVSPSESSLKGHLTGDKDSGSSGSPAYVPPDPKDDKQLNYALALLRGEQVNRAFRVGPSAVAPN
jgi:carboxyl-terminal processing protease